MQTIMEHGDILDSQWYEKFNEITRQVGLDSLTQIPNRRKFDDYFEHTWQQMSQEEAYLSLLMCDIDEFKNFNDTQGHLAGDECLRKVAQALHACMRQTNDLIARYGGEEFIALLPYTDADGARLVAERIQILIYEMNIPHRTSPIHERVTLSIGIATLKPSDHYFKEELLKLADERLYQAKRLGKNCIVGV